MRLSGKVLSALGGLALSISIAHAASAGGAPGGIDGAQLMTAEIDFAERVADVDLELVLAVDVSGSMSPEELELERNGYVAAFRDPGLIAAITDGELGGIAVTYFEWAGPKDQTVLVSWSTLSDSADALGFAASLEAASFSSARNAGSSTAISIALLFAERLMQENNLIGFRRVIDISGDGPNDSGVPIGIARDLVLEQGTTINGLPIIRGPQLIRIDRYYEHCVVGGPGSFSITISDASDFQTAIRHKLIQEIAGLRTRATPAAFQEFYPSPNECDRWYGVVPGFPPPVGLE